MSYNLKDDRIFRISGTFNIAGLTAQFVQDVDITMDAGSFQRNSDGSGASVFTQNSDVVGSFSFKLKNTISLYDPASVPVLQSTVSYWMQSIANFNPAIINFIQTLNASKSSSTTKNARIQFSGRVLKVGPKTSVDDGVGDVMVEGEITEFTGARRGA